MALDWPPSRCRRARFAANSANAPALRAGPTTASCAMLSAVLERAAPPRVHRRAAWLLHVAVASNLERGSLSAATAARTSRFPWPCRTRAGQPPHPQHRARAATHRRPNGGTMPTPTMLRRRPCTMVADSARTGQRDRSAATGCSSIGASGSFVTDSKVDSRACRPPRRTSCETSEQVRCRHAVVMKQHLDHRRARRRAKASSEIADERGCC